MNNDNCCRTCGVEQARPLRCGACKFACYCSRECQTADWPEHRGACEVTKFYEALCESFRAGVPKCLIVSPMDFLGEQRGESTLRDDAANKLYRTFPAEIGGGLVCEMHACAKISRKTAGRKYNAIIKDGKCPVLCLESDGSAELVAVDPEALRAAARS